MYKKIYKLSRNPCEISPDPSFLFPTHRHNEALAALYYGVRRHKGFVVLTGEVGTGKTLLVRCLLQLLRGTGVTYAYLFNSHLSSLEFLQYTAADFGLQTSGKGKADLLLELGTFLVNRHQKKLTTVLVADEAHHLSEEVLEEIRLLTNLETANGKLLQILLVGQPELDEKLDSVELRQLKQRIALRSHLAPLDMQETTGYIQCRLQRAGASNPIGEIFPQETVAEVQRYSRGIPRLINTICENALIAGYARQSGSISPEIIQEVGSDFRLNVVAKSKNEKSSYNEDNEVRNAVKTLLQFRDHLKNSAREQETPLIATSGVRKHEPIV